MSRQKEAFQASFFVFIGKDGVINRIKWLQYYENMKNKERLWYNHL